MVDLGFIDDIRRARGLLTIGDLETLTQRGNVIFDPFSVLISASVEVGAGNIIYPSVTLLCGGDGILSLGNNNTLFGNTLMQADTGSIRIGSSNQFGEGGFTAKTNRPGAAIEIGDGGRYLNGAAVFGESRLGSGSQIIGAVVVDSCVLEEGRPFSHPNPDLRAGLLKGSGPAKGLIVPVGHVILGSGSFSADDLKPQTYFHPRSK